MGLFSAVMNILLLVLPLYMLQVYDRVLPANNIDTLLYMTFLALAALFCFGSLEIVRGQYAGRLASRLDVAYGGPLLSGRHERPARGARRRPSIARSRHVAELQPLYQVTKSAISQ